MSAARAAWSRDYGRHAGDDTEYPWVRFYLYSPKPSQVSPALKVFIEIAREGKGGPRRGVKFS